MKIGILTFHSQLNYGGILQCWALQTAFEKLGYEVVVIDRWLSADNVALECGYNQFNIKKWTKFLVRSFLALGDTNQWLRVRRTKKFLKLHIKRTPYHFVEWKDAPENLGVDILVVGSDQVWHCGDWSDPKVYLLEDAPRIPAMAYAASFGMSQVSAEYVDLYKRGLAKFCAISCREGEGVRICRCLGFNATHVADPTLLSFYREPTERKTQGDLVCYFLSEKVEDHWQELESFARKNKCKVTIFENGAHLLPLPTNLARVKQWFKCHARNLFSLIRVKSSAGPQEFFNAFKGARYVVSDSFHALMFAICNNCDTRMIRPSSPVRRQMFARIEEFADHTDGPLVSDSVSAALESLSKGEKVVYDYEWINRRCSESLEWLMSALATIH